jgi:hypothetical protein
MRKLKFLELFALVVGIVETIGKSLINLLNHD